MTELARRTRRSRHGAHGSSATSGGGATMRRVLLWSMPLLVGAVVLGLATAAPRSPALGDAFTGPRMPAAMAPLPLGADFRVSWTEAHRRIELLVRDGAACRPARPLETSTAPARIEVVLHRPTAAVCAARPRWWRYDLDPATVAEPGQSIAVWVDGRKGSVPRFQRPHTGSVNS